SSNLRLKLGLSSIARKLPIPLRWTPMFVNTTLPLENVPATYMRGWRCSAAKAESASSSLNTRTAGSSKNLALGSVGPAAFGFCALASPGELAQCSNASCGTRRIILEITLIDERILEQPCAAFNRLHGFLPKHGYTPHG